MKNITWVKRILNNYSLTIEEQIQEWVNISDKWLGEVELEAIITVAIKRDWVDTFDRSLLVKLTLIDDLLFNMDNKDLKNFLKGVMYVPLQVKHNRSALESLDRYADRVIVDSPRWNAPLKGDVRKNGWFVYCASNTFKTQYFYTKQEALEYFKSKVISEEMYLSVGYEMFGSSGTIDILTNYFRDVEMWTLYDHRSSMFIRDYSNSTSLEKLMVNCSYDLLEHEFLMSSHSIFDEFIEDCYTIEQLADMFKKRWLIPVKHYDVCDRIIKFDENIEKVTYKWEEK